VKFKLDENLSRRAADLIRAAGHDAVTVASQGLRGAADETLFEVYRRESRALVTLDRPPASLATDRRFKARGLVRCFATRRLPVPA
jgi:predicted nuclease of predicted toxin-antitoxin system